MKEKQLPLISLIFIVKNEGTFIYNTVQSALSVQSSYPFEIILVDDGSTDGCCDFVRSEKRKSIRLLRGNDFGIAKARNLGALHARGEYFIFCDGHLVFEDHWMEKLIEPIQKGIADATNPCIADAENPLKLGFGYSWSKNLEIKWNPGLPMLFPSSHLAGGCLAISRKTFYAINGFDAKLKTWGYDDQELSLKLWLFGYRCYIQPKVKILHYFRRSAPPYKLRRDEIHFNFLRMAFLHFNDHRIDKCKQLIHNSNVEEIESQVLSSGALELRNQYFQQRKYDDDWYMKKFNIPF